MLSFLKSYFLANINYILKFFHPKGKASRQEFNMVMLSLPFWVVILFSYINWLYFHIQPDHLMRFILVFTIIADQHIAISLVVFGAICTIFLLSIAIRRLKDLGASPWSVLLILVPIVQLGLLGVLALAPSDALREPINRKENEHA